MEFRRRLTSLIVVPAVLSSSLLAGPDAIAQTAEREQAVMWARAGDLDRAIGRLRELRAIYPRDAAIGYDLSVILQWAGGNLEALEVFQTIASPLAPDYALFAAATAARAVGRVDEADAYLQQGERLFPGQRRWAVARALVYVDAGRLDEARAILGKLYGDGAPDIDGLRALGYLHTQALEWPAALRNYSEVLRRRPDDPEALKGTIIALAALGAPFRAADIAQAHSGVIDAAENARVAGTEPAMRLRWGTFVVAEPRHRFDDVDRAITTLQQQIANLEANPLPGSAALRRAQFDLLTAFRARYRMEEALALYEQLRREHVVVPAYSRLNAAAAYLHLERPREAKAIYESVVMENQPKLEPELRFEARLGLFYSCVELEKFDQAYAVIDALDREQPLFQKYREGPANNPNDDKLLTATVSALARYYGGQVAKAWDRMQPLADAAPDNTDLRSDLAEIARSRGWPRRAFALVQPWSVRDPDDLTLSLEHASGLFALGRFADARPAIERLSAQYPENKAIQGLKRDWDVHDSSEVEVRVTPSEGFEPEVPGFGLLAVGNLWSPPIGSAWRVNVGYRYAVSDMQEGREVLHRSAAGLKYQGPAWQGYGELSYNTSTKDQMGGHLEAEWTPDDHWSAHAVGEIFSEETPMKALKNGVTANMLGGGGRYRFHESREIALAWRGTDFSDGNVRHEVFPRVTQRALSLPRVNLDATVDLYFSTNSSDEVAYFSPTRFFAPTLALAAEHVMWRLYRHSLAQRVTASITGTFQEGFPGIGTGGVAYEHEWNFGARHSVSYGARAAKRTYDGARQLELAGFVSTRMRF